MAQSIMEGEKKAPAADAVKTDRMQTRQYSPLTLAYAGDAAYELVIRTMLVRKANQPVHQLHREASSLVKAEKQSEMAGILEPLFTEEEEQIYRRGRNAKANTHARSAGIQEYRRATGFEAVIGYLYLSGQEERMLELIAAGLQISMEELRATGTGSAAHRCPDRSRADSVCAAEPVPVARSKKEIVL